MPNMMNYKMGGNRRTLKCPNTGKITAFNIYAGNWVDSIGFECEDGTKYETLGGTGGKYYPIKSPNGFSELYVRSGDWVDSI